MSLFHRWRACCRALCLVALAVPALNAQHITVDCGEISTGRTTGSHGVVAVTDVTVVFGCVPATPAHQWGITGYADNQFSVPAPVNGIQMDQRVFTSGAGAASVLIGGPFTTEGKPFSRDVTMRAALRKTGSLAVLDEQTITVTFTGTITYVPGAPLNGPAQAVSLVYSLKPGGPDAGKTRLPVDEEPPEELPKDTRNVVTDFPNSYVGDDGRVYDVKPPDYTIGNQTGNWGNGTRWRQITSPPGSVNGWKIPGSLTFDSGGSTWTVGSFNRDFTGWTGSVTRGPDGTTYIEVNGSGYGQNYSFTFPPGYKPQKIDGMGDPEEPTDPDDIDPCFRPYYDSTGGGGNPNPDPDPDGPEDPPDGTEEPSGPDTPTLPGSPGGGGGGGGGGGTPAPGPGVPTGPVIPPPPGGGAGPPGGPLPPNYTPGAPLPADDDPTKWAQEAAGKVASKTGEVQEVAKGLMGWGTVEAGGFGQAGEWTIPLQIAGGVYSMTIPTWHASAFRAVLLLIIKALFIVGVFKLLIS